MDIIYNGKKINRINLNSSVTWDDLIGSFRELKESHDKKLQRDKLLAIKLFNEVFNADFNRGDVIVFGSRQNEVFHMCRLSLPAVIMKQIKLDMYSDKAIILNGEYLGLGL